MKSTLNTLSIWMWVISVSTNIFVLLFSPNANFWNAGFVGAGLAVLYIELLVIPARKESAASEEK